MLKNTLTLGDRMKLYESAMDIKLNPCMHYMIRLDGKNFSKMIKRWSLEKPFDENFNCAMNTAARSLFHLIPNVNLIWHGSDEISAWFTSPNVANLFFDGRIQKIISLAASQATIMFNAKMINTFGNTIGNNYGIFDCRIMQFPNEKEAINCFIFRQRDCIRNSISGYAQHYFSDKQLHSKNSDEKLEMIKQAGYDWNNFPDWSKYGTFIHKKNFKIDSTENASYIRSGYINLSVKLETIEDFTKFLTAANEPQNILEVDWVKIKNIIR